MLFRLSTVSGMRARSAGHVGPFNTKTATYEDLTREGEKNCIAGETEFTRSWFGRQSALMPPSHGNTVPVVRRASSLSRKRAALAHVIGMGDVVEWRVLGHPRPHLVGMHPPIEHLRASRARRDRVDADAGGRRQRTRDRKSVV